MDKIFTGFSWLDQLLPQGFPIHTSTLLSGPGGSGKPLIGDAIVSAWLRQGGSVVFMSLQYPSNEFIFASLKGVANLDLNEYLNNIIFIELDATIDDMKIINNHHIKANMVKPLVWKNALTKACEMIPDQGPGKLVFSSAINLLLFSPTYGEKILEQMKETISDTDKCTYLFAASTTAKKEEVEEIEAVVDNLVFTYSEKQPFRLHMQIKRLKDLPFSKEEILVPIPPDALLNVKEIADHSRKRVIPLISKI
ncbi:MAG: hypothetical protein J7L73_02600 [Anaerolineales bacterium]|nr:hypothetical protein [Anaerolineales bacterium]